MLAGEGLLRHSIMHIMFDALVGPSDDAQKTKKSCVGRPMDRLKLDARAIAAERPRKAASIDRAEEQ